MKTGVDPVFLDIMKSAVLFIAEDWEREKEFLALADVTDEQWRELVGTIYGEQEAE